MKIVSSLLIILGTFFSLCAQTVPAVYTNIGSDEKGVFLRLNDRNIYAIPPKDKFKYDNLYQAASGTRFGLNFDFKYPELNGTLYYGFINYKDGSFPQPVYFRESSPITNGHSNIPILKYLSGKYDMVNWQKTGKAIIGYRIANEKGEFLYDGKIAFSYANNLFQSEVSLVEGPFINLLSNRGAVISYLTSDAIETKITINGRQYKDRNTTKHHEIKINDLEASTKYDYTLSIGEFEYKFHFETAPNPGSRLKFSFAYGSDSRAGNGGGERNIFGTNAYIMKKIAALAKSEDVKFVQFTGDLINGYENSKERMMLQYANWKHSVEAYWHYIPFVVGMGNHEAFNFVFNDPENGGYYAIDHFPFDTNSSESLFQKNFVLPNNGPISEDNSSYDPNPEKRIFPSYKESVYWYAYDNVAIVVLNSNYLYSPNGANITSGNIHAFILENQVKWLQKTLRQLEKNKAIDHVFISIHTPFFPNGGHVNDDMWYNGDNRWRAVIAGIPYRDGIIQQRDKLLNLIVNKSKKTIAILSGDEHNYNLLNINRKMNRYPENYPHGQLELSRDFYQINNGAAGAPYYAQEKTPWSAYVRNFSTQNALVIIDIDGAKVKVRVKNPDTLELIDEYNLRE